MIDTTGMTRTEVLKIGLSYVKRNEIEHIIIASTRSDSALEAADIFLEEGKSFCVATHSSGFRESNRVEFDSEKRALLEKRNIL